MVSPATFFKNLPNNIKTFLFEKDLSTALIVTSALGWVLSSLGQIFGMLRNDKLSKEEKKFLIPQEMADAVVNIGSFLLITKSVSKFTKWLASSGKIITKDISKFCSENGIEITKKTDIGKAVLDKVSEFEATLKTIANEKILDKIEQVDASKIQVEIKKLNLKKQKLNNFYDETYKPFESGAAVIGTIGGGVIASNVVTPLVRNYFAAKKQKEALAQEKMQKPVTLTPAASILPQNKLSIDSYKSKTKPTTITTGGSMKI